MILPLAFLLQAWYLFFATGLLHLLPRSHLLQQGLHPLEDQSHGLSAELCNIIAQTISQGIDAVLHQRGLIIPLASGPSRSGVLHTQLQPDTGYNKEDYSPFF